MYMNQLQGESTLEFEERNKFYNFITSKNISNKYTIAKIYCNIKYRKCIYSHSIYNFIKKLEEEFLNR